MEILPSDMKQHKVYNPSYSLVTYSQYVMLIFSVVIASIKQFLQGLENNKILVKPFSFHCVLKLLRHGKIRFSFYVGMPLIFLILLQSNIELFLVS